MTHVTASGHISLSTAQGSDLLDLDNQHRNQLTSTAISTPQPCNLFPSVSANLRAVRKNLGVVEGVQRKAVSDDVHRELKEKTRCDNVCHIRKPHFSRPISRSRISRLDDSLPLIDSENPDRDISQLDLRKKHIQFIYINSITVSAGSSHIPFLHYTTRKPNPHSNSVPLETPDSRIRKPPTFVLLHSLSARTIEPETELVSSPSLPSLSLTCLSRNVRRR